MNKELTDAMRTGTEEALRQAIYDAVRQGEKNPVYLLAEAIVAVREPEDVVRIAIVWPKGEQPRGRIMYLEDTLGKIMSDDADTEDLTAALLTRIPTQERGE